MSNPSDYTVGWICGISTEYVAAQAFLDEKHEGPDSVARNDNNDYILGRIGKHNVAIAVLPLGEYGLSSAASVARDMLHSFPNIRIGLMVGIAGGAPSLKHDIRLGDIVVSASGNGRGGVFQYDFGKTVQGRKFHQTGFLNQPPQILRAAVNGLKAQYEADGHNLTQMVNKAIEKTPRLRKKYTRPEANTDRLYLSGIVHPQDDDATCDYSCSDPYLSLLQVRPDRTEDDDNPAIHYGLIASGNHLMKDAALRDALAAEKDVLCFEMESAGLMNHFPCLVIRGICDYSDTHGNEEWQGYAAMGAAAYAKDILYRISPSKVEAEKKISQQAHEHSQESVCILNWLTSMDYRSQQEQYFGMRQPGTCQWLLESTEYQAWLGTKSECLLYSGIPGAGKTIFISTIIDDLYNRFSNDSKVGIAFIYCSYLQDQKLNDLLASILKQLFQCQSSLPTDIKSLYAECMLKKRRPLLEEILTALRSVITLFAKVFIVVDALDECRKSCRSELLSVIFGLQAKANVNLVATSRPLLEVDKEFENCSTLKSLQIQAHDEDIYRYLDTRMSSLRVSMLDKQDLWKEITQTIIKEVEGIEIKASLKELQTPTKGQSPQGRKIDMLSEAYNRTMERIVNQQLGLRELATKVLSWIVCARRPLSALELQHALAIKPEDSALDEDNIREIDIIMSVCSGLLTVNQADGTVRLVHYTTQEYFERMKNVWLPHAEDYLTTACITYLSFNVFDGGLCPTGIHFGERLRSHPLYDYAAKKWGHHARRALTCHQLVMQFLAKSNHVKASTDAAPKEMAALHLAAYFGLEAAVDALLSSGHGPNSTDRGGHTALSWAANNGYDAVVARLLAQPGVNVNCQATKHDISCRTPLSIAAENGYAAVVQLLLKHPDVVPDLRDGAGRTPLSFAARGGHCTVVGLLLAHPGVNPDSCYMGEYLYAQLARTPLSFAAEEGHAAVVELLLAQPGVDPDSKDVNDRTPLSFAAEKGHAAVVELLLAQPGVDPDSKDVNDRTPLSFAAEKGHAAIVKLLLAQPSVNPDSASQDTIFSTLGRTPLSFAAENGHAAVDRTYFGYTPLSFAAHSGHRQVVELLLKQPNVDIYHTTGRAGEEISPLSLAQEKRHEDIVQMINSVLARRLLTYHRVDMFNIVAVLV
ncbi:hypothetical protein V8C35DRAFT_321484 [Trichoderma chlorosporum]